MSGGHFEYQQHRLHDIAEQLEEDLKLNGVEDEYGSCHDIPLDVVESAAQAIAELQRLQRFLHDFDYAISGDRSWDDVGSYRVK